jgi:chromate transporter
MIYLQLFISYLKIGFFGFGGGYAMLSLIHNEVVVQNMWLTNEEFTNIVAISQMTPGPIAINSATYVGYTVAGFWGSVVATLSVCLPALTLMILITRFFLKLKDNPYMRSTIAFMRPVVMGMILAGAMLLIFPSTKEGASFIDGWSWALFGVALVASLKKVSPILLIALSAVAGVAIYYLPTVIG